MRPPRIPWNLCPAAVAGALLLGLPGLAGAADGGQLFQQTCSACHGVGARGDGPVAATLAPPPANLTDPAFQDQRSDEQLGAVIRGGGASVGRSPMMPAFGQQLDDEQVAAIIGWIREQKATAALGVAAPASAPVASKPAPLPAANPFSANRFHLAGFAEVHFQYTEETGPNFSSVGFSPVFLWRLHDRFLFEAELEMAYANSEFDFGVEYAQLDMILWDYITVVAGLSLNPLGVFGERLHPGWINRMMDKPYPYQGGHENSPVPMGGLGIQVRGAIPLGRVSSVNYAFFLNNGPAESNGELAMGGTVPDNNWDKNLGGRIGLLPIRELEVGVSGTTGLWNTESNRRFSALIGDLMFSKSGLNVQGEFLATWTEKEGLSEAEARKLWWAQVAYRFETAPGILNKFEIVFRYGGAALPEATADEGSLASALQNAQQKSGPTLAFSSGHAGAPADEHGAMANMALPGGLSNQVGGGVNFYPVPSIAIRLGAHYTIETQHFHLGLSAAVGF